MVGRTLAGKVVAALVLSQYGTLGGERWDCKACQEQHAMCQASGLTSKQDALGCGKPPTVRGGATWDPESWLEENGRDESPHSPYRFGNLGNVGRLHGWLWPWCPQWFLSFADSETLGLAVEAVEMFDWLEMGALAQYQSGELTAAAADLVVTAKRQRNHCQAEALRKEASK